MIDFFESVHNKSYWPLFPVIWYWAYEKFKCHNKLKKCQKQKLVIDRHHEIFKAEAFCRNILSINNIMTPVYK